jgi:hypothetical protein
MSAIFKALAAAQKNFEAARKSSENGHFKSKYADLSNCMDAVRLPCNEQGIFVTQTIESVESGILVETVFAHESGETYLGGKLFMPVTKHDAHGYGSALTYARRYSLLAACGVAPEDDDGNSAAANKPDKITNIREPKIKMGALDGIGDDLPQEAKEALKDLAAEAIELVAQNQPEQALATIKAFGAEGDEKIYLDRQLPSHVRSAFRKLNQKAA